MAHSDPALFKALGYGKIMVGPELVRDAGDAICQVYRGASIANKFAPTEIPGVAREH